jgi:hypothetical protein
LWCSVNEAVPRAFVTTDEVSNLNVTPGSAGTVRIVMVTGHGLT